MGERRRRPPGWVWITAAVIVLPLLYFLSVGPVLWLDAHGMLHGWIWDAASWYTAPSRFVYDHAPRAVQRIFDAYRELWSGSP